MTVDPSTIYVTDRLYDAPLEGLPGPALRPEDLRAGDVLFFRGSHPMSRSIRFFDDCLFDHIAFVCDPPEGAPVGGPWLYDMGFEEPRCYPLTQYEERPYAVLVRRHRNPAWRGPVMANAVKIGAETKGYSWERIITIILYSLTKYSAQMKQNAVTYAARHLQESWSEKDYEQLVGRNPKVFLKNLNTFLYKAEEELERSGPMRVCIDLVYDAFDCTLNGSFDSDDPYFGLVVPRRPHNGLLAWAASGQRFVDYLLSGAEPEADPEPDFDPNALIDQLWLQYNLAASERVVIDLDDPDDEVSDDDLRQTVNEATRMVLRILGWREEGNPGHATAPPPGSLNAMAAYLLDQMLRHRVILTQSDIVSTKSLYDAGHLDLTSVEWANLNNPPRRT